MHPLTGIDHLLAMLAVGVIASSARSRRIAWLTPIGFVTGMLAGGALGMAGIGLPVTEITIAASVVVLGVLIVTTTHNAGFWLPIMAAAFGAAHGHAHGAELPDGAAHVAYAAGFIAATAALHLSGTGIGLALRRLPSVRIALGSLVTAAGVGLLFAL